MTNEMRQQLILPRHIGIIMDGNGRWAKQRGLERSEGHKAGANVFRRICDYGAELGIECMTFYAFSTENWKRPKKEVDAIMKLLEEYLDKDFPEDVRIRVIGDINALSNKLIEKINAVVNSAREP